jgi:hypothetical protein
MIASVSRGSFIDRGNPRFANRRPAHRAVAAATGAGVSRRQRFILPCSLSRRFYPGISVFLDSYVQTLGIAVQSCPEQ